MWQRYWKNSSVICQSLSFQKRFKQHFWQLKVSFDSNLIRWTNLIYCDDCLFCFVSEMKNIQEQIGHLQHIIQLLPLINRDTLYVLLQFLGLVAENAEDKLDETGKEGKRRKTFLRILSTTDMLQLIGNTSFWELKLKIFANNIHAAVFFAKRCTTFLLNSVANFVHAMAQVF